MSPNVTLKDRVEYILRKKSELDARQTSNQPTVLIATIDPEIRSGLTDIFEAFSLNIIWMKGVEAAKSILAKEKISACLCGFWLQDGTYRELVRHIRRERVEIPVIIVSAPACPNEYRDYLSALKIGAVDFLSHPYRKSELERMLWLAIGARERSMNHPMSLINTGLHTGGIA